MVRRTAYNLGESATATEVQRKVRQVFDTIVSLPHVINVLRSYRRKPAAPRQSQRELFTLPTPMEESVGDALFSPVEETISPQEETPVLAAVRLARKYLELAGGLDNATRLLELLQCRDTSYPAR